MEREGSESTGERAGAGLAGGAGPRRGCVGAAMGTALRRSRVGAGSLAMCGGERAVQPQRVTAGAPPRWRVPGWAGAPVGVLPGWAGAPVGVCRLVCGGCWCHCGRRAGSFVPLRGVDGRGMGRCTCACGGGVARTQARMPAVGGVRRCSAAAGEGVPRPPRRRLPRRVGTGRRPAGRRGAGCGGLGIEAGEGAGAGQIGAVSGRRWRRDTGRGESRP